MKRALSNRIPELSASLINDAQRMRVQFISVYALLAAVSIFMTIVNVFTQKYLLMLSTLAFAIANVTNLLLSIREGKGRQLASVIFSLELTVLFVFFIVSGEPEGFSAIWVCLLPASGLLLFGKRRGTALCAVELVILLFFFYVPAGRELLRYEYTESFRLRFPMLYIAFFAVAYFLEVIRSATYAALQESRRQYQHLYSHDALTNVYNRYGFNEHMDSLLLAPEPHKTALLILDIDFFKNVNDSYGHTGGDIVLKAVAALLTEKSGKDASVCRWGGEEFAVILTSGENSEEIALEILRGIRALSVPIGAKTARVTASIGMVEAPAGVRVDPAALVTQTDRCLYKAKAEGRDRIVRMPYKAQE